VGSDLSRLLILRNGRVVYTRDHPFGGNQLTEEIMRRYDMTPEQANFFMRGEPGPENFEEEVLEPFMLNVVHQISRALQFYSSSAEFSNIRTIYLSGTMASIKGLSEVVEQELGIKSSVADPVAGMELAPSVAVAALNRNSPSLMVATGLALRGFD
jgi:type IV pilus assembly protein PilM